MPHRFTSAKIGTRSSRSSGPSEGRPGKGQLIQQVSPIREQGVALNTGSRCVLDRPTAGVLALFERTGGAVLGSGQAGAGRRSGAAFCARAGATMGTTTPAAERSSACCSAGAGGLPRLLLLLRPYRHLCHGRSGCPLSPGVSCRADRGCTVVCRHGQSPGPCRAVRATLAPPGRRPRPRLRRKSVLKVLEGTCPLRSDLPQLP
jgi:hypothetical protein